MKSDKPSSFIVNKLLSVLKKRELFVFLTIDRDGHWEVISSYKTIPEAEELIRDVLNLAHAEDKRDLN